MGVNAACFPAIIDELKEMGFKAGVDGQLGDEIPPDDLKRAVIRRSGAINDKTIDNIILKMVFVGIILKKGVFYYLV